MDLAILSVPGCPNTTVLDERLTEALGDRRDVRITHHTVTDETGASRWGMHGSPTLLVDGRDPFPPPPGSQPSLSCRIYRGADAAAQGAPTVGQLRAVLTSAPR